MYILLVIINIFLIIKDNQVHLQPRKNQESECHSKVKASVVSSKNKN